LCYSLPGLSIDIYKAGANKMYQIIVSVLRMTYSRETDFLPAVMTMSVYQISIGDDSAVPKLSLYVIRLDER
jgi:hypothetical protein